MMYLKTRGACDAGDCYTVLPYLSSAVAKSGGDHAFHRTEHSGLSESRVPNFDE